MSRLVSAMVAPEFAVADVFGVPVRLADYRGQRLLLSFYRYASCPLCNLRVHELLQHHAEW